MNTILKVRIPFFRRVTSNTGDGIATFYLNAPIADFKLPALNQTVLISHTAVPTGSHLANRISSISTNTVGGTFQLYSVNTDTTASANYDYYNYFLRVKYVDPKFSLDVYAGGDCTGYIEYEVNPTATLSTLKPIEAAVVVNDMVPFDLQEGYNLLYASSNGLTGTTQHAAPMLFVDRQSTNTIFANTLKGLNLPVTDNEQLKYSRTKWGYPTTPVGTQVPTFYKNTVPFFWNPITGATLPGDVLATDLITHPVTGTTGEHYQTALQSIGSYEFITDYGKLPVPNDMFLIMEIPPKTYGEIIDGKSLKILMPYWTGTTPTAYANKYLGIYSNSATYATYTYNATPTFITLYGAYNKSGLNVYDLDNALSEKDLSLKDLGANPDLSPSGVLSDYESNTVLLFSDAFGKPSENPTGSWGDGHSDVINGIRAYNPSSRTKSLYDNIKDDCVGIAYLDKGFMVITNPKIVDSFYINAFNGKITSGGTISQPLKIYNNYGTAALNTNLFRHNSSSGAGVKTYTGQTTNFILTKNNINQIEWENTEFLYTGTTSVTHPAYPSIEYLSYNSEKSLNVVCLASSSEFFTSTNDTAKELFNADDADYVSFYTNNQNLYPVIITQLGLHDADGNLLAICKPTQPIPKYWYDVVSFNVRIRL